MTKPSLWFLLISCFGELYGQSTQGPVAGAEKLDWKADQTYAVNPYDTAFGFYLYHLRSLSYVKQNVVAWTIGLPERMQHYRAASVYDKSVSSGDDAIPTRKLTLNEIDLNAHKEFLKCPELILDDVIAISDISGFLLLDKKQGTVLADIPDERSSGEHLYLDSGRYDIRIRNASCSGTLQHGAAFTSYCSGYLFHFNGYALLVFNRNNRLIKRIEYNSELHGRTSKISHREAFFKDKKYTLQIAGVVYLR